MTRKHPVSIFDLKPPTKIEKVLDAWPEDAVETLELVERFTHLQKKFGGEYDLAMTLYLRSVSQEEIDAVLQAEDKLAAARALSARKINMWD